MSQKSVPARINQRLKNLPDGKPFVTSYVRHLGNRDSVDKALERMTRKGALVRLARGIYAKPKSGVFVKSVKPSPEAIALAVADADNADITFDGAKALQLLGLSTQEPVQPVYITNGRSRKIKYGKVEIKLKHRSRMPSNLRGKAALAYSALVYLGKNEVTQEVIASIAAQLSKDERDALLIARANMPAWLSDALAMIER